MPDYLQIFINLYYNNKLKIIIFKIFKETIKTQN